MNTKKLLPNLILLLATIAICILFLEILLRFTLPLPDSCQFYAQDDLLIYKNKANIDYQSKTSEFQVTYATNQNGLREQASYKNNKQDETRILTIGDSFVYGVGLNSEDTFQKRLQNKTENTLVINAGVNGYGTEQPLLWLQREIDSYQPDIVLFSFYNNDPNDNSRYKKVTVENNCLISKSINPFKKFLYFKSRTYLLTQSVKNYLFFGNEPVRNLLINVRTLLAKLNLAEGVQIAYPVLYKTYTPELQANIDNALTNIKSMDDLCRKKNCRFILNYIPAKLQVNAQHQQNYLKRNNLDPEDFDFEKIASILEIFAKENNIEFINFQAEFEKEGFDDENVQIYWTFDPHFNKQGAEVVSTILYNRLLPVI